MVCHKHLNCLHKVLIMETHKILNRLHFLDNILCKELGERRFLLTRNFIENYNKTSESNIASIMQLENGAVVVADIE